MTCVLFCAFYTLFCILIIPHNASLPQHPHLRPQSPTQKKNKTTKKRDFLCLTAPSSTAIFYFKLDHINGWRLTFYL